MSGIIPCKDKGSRLKCYICFVSNQKKDGNVPDDALAEIYAVLKDFSISSDLYPTPIEKAAAAIESCRTGYTLMRLTLLSHEMDSRASEEEKYEFVIQIAEGKLAFHEILKWMENKLENKS